MKRICVKCKDPLKNQKTYHTSSKEVTHGTWKSHWCDGPRDTPGYQEGRTRLPVHYRDYASAGYKTVCGLEGGRTKGKYAYAEAEVPPSRLNVNLKDTTCEHCLIALIKRCKQALRTRLAAIQKSALTAGREARATATVAGLKKLVNA